jgi:hypothetical protein
VSQDVPLNPREDLTVPGPVRGARVDHPVGVVLEAIVRLGPATMRWGRRRAMWVTVCSPSQATESSATSAIGTRGRRITQPAAGLGQASEGAPRGSEEGMTSREPPLSGSVGNVRT